jgi:CBS domain-containing protein
MRTNIVALPEDMDTTDRSALLHQARTHRGQELYPVVSESGTLCGVTTRRRLADFLERGFPFHNDPVVAFPDEPLRVVVNRMAETGRTRLPVIDCPEHGKLAGIVSLEDLLQARVRHVEEEKRRERALRIRLPFLTARPAQAVPVGETDERN